MNKKTNYPVQSTIYRYHPNGVVGECDVTYWMKNQEPSFNGSFPDFFMRPSATVIPELRISLRGVNLCFPLLDGLEKSALPSLCRILMRMPEDQAAETLAVFAVRAFVERNMHYLKKENCNVLNELTSWLKAKHGFVVNNWEELFTQAADKYAYVFEDVPASLPITRDTLEYLDKERLKACVAKRFTVFHFLGKLVGVINDTEADA